MGNETRGFGLEFAERELCARLWTLFREGQEPIGRYVRFQAGGFISGWYDDMKHYWDLRAGVFRLLDDCRCSFARMQRVTIVDNLIRLDLTVEGTGEPLTLLERIEFGSTVHAAPLISSSIRAPHAGARRDLVIVRANEASQHVHWPKNITNEDRTWDLMVSFYGSGENFGTDPNAEYQVHQLGWKYAAIHSLFYDASPLWTYKRFALVDDDIMTTWRDMNEMFALFTEFDLALAQPALSGHVIHPITLPNKDYLLRFTSFVEVMTPWFSRDALRTCLPTFLGNDRGFGMDHIWPKLLGEPRNKLAIVDKIVVEHTRPLAMNYDLEKFVGEAWGFQMAYSAYPRQAEFGGILRAPQNRYQDW